MNPRTILARTFPPGSPALRIVLRHGEQVAARALAAAEKLRALTPDRAFLEEAALLHDIGVVLTDSPGIGCHGEAPYICHGVLGRGILEREGLPRHALACERHVGAGITAEEIRRRGLPLPERDMLPVSLEEEILCWADKFYSKTGEKRPAEKSLEEVLAGLRRFGEESVARFLAWHARFG